jgi:hypothetical protein
MKTAYIIYHPKRESTPIGNLIVYHDSFSGNQDPYIWNESFLHTFCHITQLSNEEGQINFWVSGDVYPNFKRLLCDCVFVVEQKLAWEKNNCISRNDPIVDNSQAFEHHYKWVSQHPFRGIKRPKKRYTLKAHSKKSFQPQDRKKDLIDIVPFLKANGVSLKKLRNSISIRENGEKRRHSQPSKLPDGIGEKLYDYLKSTAETKLRGKQLSKLYPNQS